MAIYPNAVMPDVRCTLAFFDRKPRRYRWFRLDYHTDDEADLLGNNRISSIEPDDFSGLTNLTLSGICASNQLSSIESGDFSGLTNLTELGLMAVNQISSIESGDFSGLTNLDGS